MFSFRLIVAANFVAALLVCALPVVAGEDPVIERLASEIAQLRSEVDSEERAIARQRRETDAELSSLTVELEELRLQADRAEARARSLRSAVRERQAELSERTSQRDDLRAPLLLACDAIEAGIAETAPLHRAERTKRVTDLRDRIASGSVSPQDGLDELADIVRDEIELSGTTQLTKEVVTIDGEERLIPVVALGTSLIFWKLDDDRAGLIARRDGRWSSVAIESKEQRSAVEALYQAERTSTQTAVLPLFVPRPVSGESEGGEQ